MWDVNNTSDMQTLRDSIDASLKDLEPFRTHYRSYLTEMVGTYYSDDAASKAVNVNLLELATTVYLQQLLALPPRVNVTTYNRRVRPAGTKLEQTVNDSLRDYTVFAALQRATRTAIGSIGIVKVGMESKGTYDEGGYTFHKLQPFVRHIQLDDWVHDMSAKAIGEWSYCGHVYEMELEEAKNNPDFDEAVRSKLTAHDDTTKNAGGEERTSTIQGQEAAKSRIRKTVALWEVFLPKEQQLITFSMEGPPEPLRVVQWEGPEHGPFHLLWFDEVDGNSMPLAPASLWMGLHKIVNALYRKLDRQSARQKTISAVQSNDAADGTKMTEASDGDGVVVNNPASIKEVPMGGVDQKSFGFMLQSKDLFSWLNGNLDVLGGLAPGSDTVGQDKMLNANSSLRITKMQNRVLLWVKCILTDYAWYLWEDPTQTYSVEVQVPEYGPIQSQLTPQEREHSFYEHQLDVEPYSMTFQTPQERVQKLMQVVGSFLVPAMQDMQQQGVAIDWVQLNKLMAENMQLPELEAILTVKGAPMDADRAKGPPDSGRPAATKHTSERITSPGKSNTANRDGALVQKLMGGNLQESEMAGAA